ncbi:hypothetical protein GCM10011512_09130 [Tersicoccus solisilvae]|uniref:Uncharacterized protein n=1 Tax=Tersicoccus solisilvae TaxID=1882339 RepID=A0ABQ1NUR8_9MICC|nr:hypothetical protein [Tersicoccus solisilvae]GGC84471.1 hypothetical protein GCM10011512_09130 [Tersicoccus solisilvae]
MADWRFEFDDQSQQVIAGSEDDAERLAAMTDELREAMTSVNRCADRLGSLVREVVARGDGSRGWVASVTGLTVSQVQAALDDRPMFGN